MRRKVRRSKKSPLWGHCCEYSTLALWAQADVLHIIMRIRIDVDGSLSRFGRAPVEEEQQFSHRLARFMRKTRAARLTRRAKYRRPSVPENCSMRSKLLLKQVAQWSDFFLSFLSFFSFFLLFSPFWSRWHSDQTWRPLPPWEWSSQLLGKGRNFPLKTCRTYQPGDRLAFLFLDTYKHL